MSETLKTASLCAVAALYGQRALRSYLGSRNDADVTKTPDTKESNSASRALLYLLRICFRGGFGSRTLWVMIIQATFLYVRAVLQFRVATASGGLMRALVDRSYDQLKQAVTTWLLTGIPAAIIMTLENSFRQFSALELRQCLTNHAMNLYMDHDTYYRAGSTNQWPQLQNVDQVLTEDIKGWGDRTSTLLSSVIQPCIDLTFINIKLFQIFGFRTQLLTNVILWESRRLLDYIRPAFTTIVQERMEADGILRAQHRQVINYREEVGFSRGGPIEQSTLTKLFTNIYTFQLDTIKNRFPSLTMEDFLTKYVWVAIFAVQMMKAEAVDTDSGDTGKMVQKLTEMTHLTRGNSAALKVLTHRQRLIEEFNGYSMRLARVLRGLENASECQPKRIDSSSKNDDSSVVDVSDLTLATPEGTVLAWGITFAVLPRDRVLITGPNGSGKSSLLRVLAGLWDFTEGTVRMPPPDKVIFLSQRPLMTTGTLREQLLYPDNELVPDEDLEQVIKDAELTDVVSRSGGLNAVGDWMLLLSGGEKQRVAMARVMLRRPALAVLDECTSALSADAEVRLFERLCALDTALLTISHRPTLKKFHSKELAFSQDGKVSFKSL